MSRRKSLAATAAGLVAVMALIAGCSSGPETDPHQILSKAQTSLKNLQSVHFHLEAGGQFSIGVPAQPTDPPVASTSPDASASAGASSSAAAGSPSVGPSVSVAPSPSPTPVPSPSTAASAVPSATPVYTAVPVSLQGATADGDIDYANKTAHLSGGLPGLPDFSGELIVVNPYSYYRAYGATKFKATGAADLTINPALPEQTLFILQRLVAAANDSSLSPVLVGTEDEASGPCYHIRVSVTQAAMSKQLASLTIVQEKGSGSMDLWITRGDFQLERLEFSTSDPEAGTAAVRLILSNWNNVEKITGPGKDDFTIPGLEGE